MLNFKIYDIKDRKTNKYITHITHYLKKHKQSGNEIWLVNKT